MLPVSHNFWQFINLSPLDLFKYFTFLDCKLKTVLRMFCSKRNQSELMENPNLNLPVDLGKSVSFLPNKQGSYLPASRWEFLHLSAL